MAFTSTLAGEVALLKYMLNAAAATNVRLHLYTNTHTPAESDTLGNYTESTAAGYASISLLGGSWTVSSVTGTACATYGAQKFTFSTTTSLYGYYVTDNASSILIWADKFPDAPFLVALSGSVTIDPVQICQRDCS